MPAIRRLYDVCKMSFSDNGPISSEALEHVRSVLGEISSFAITSFFEDNVPFQNVDKVLLTLVDDMC
ncbi:hypothetical protein B296_00047764 [Ensete ventricosum]|uniref:Uncharacterized protein n=1 Tax=Ensete ventricosum TaxID=4639 RepID=A0A426XDC7_ENSVE|nr:hypothetical protein B296_00047764 [Ensete ventricosum]